MLDQVKEEKIKKLMKESPRFAEIVDFFLKDKKNVKLHSSEIQTAYCCIKDEQCVANYQYLYFYLLKEFYYDMDISNEEFRRTTLKISMREIDFLPSMETVNRCRRDLRQNGFFKFE